MNTRVMKTAIALSAMLFINQAHAEQQPPTIGGGTMQFIASIMTDDNGDMQVSIRPSMNGWIEREHEPGCYYKGSSEIVCLKMKTNNDGLPPDGGIRAWRPDRTALAYLQRLRRVEDNALLQRNELTLQNEFDNCMEQPSKEYTPCDNYIYWSKRYRKRWQDYPQERSLMMSAKIACDKMGSDKSIECIHHQELEDMHGYCYTLDKYHEAVPPCTLYKREAAESIAYYADWSYPRGELNELERQCDDGGDYGVCRDKNYLLDHYNACNNNGRPPIGNACIGYRHLAGVYSSRYTGYPPSNDLWSRIDHACRISWRKEQRAWAINACDDYTEVNRLYKKCWDIGLYYASSPCTGYRDEGTRRIAGYQG